MQFLFVDKITEMGSDEIKGELCIANGPYTRTDIEGSFVSSGYISEAIGQLASWLAIAKSDFTKKPVFLFCPEISYGIPAPTSKVIQIYSRIDRMEDDSMIFRRSVSERSNNRELKAVQLPFNAFGQARRSGRHQGQV